MKAKPCTLVVNNRWGYEYTPVQCKSIAEARRKAKGWFGFAYRIFVKDEETGKTTIYAGYCDD